VRRLSFAQRFLLGSLVILLVGMVGIGFWVSNQISDGVIHRTAATNALYVDSLVAPRAQDLATSESLSGDSIDKLDWLLTGTPLGQQVSLFRIWDQSGRIVYSSDHTQIGQQFPIEADWQSAFNGEVVAEMSNFDAVRSADANQNDSKMLEIYSPVRARGTNDIIAVAEFYFDATDLRHDIQQAERHSWMIVAAGTAAVYLLLAVFVQQASNTISRQQQTLANQVDRLTDVLNQNQELHERVRSAAARTTALNERFLRRFSAELHDGPAQDISLALLQLDNVEARIASQEPPADDQAETERDLSVIQSSLLRALEDVRATSSGLLLPQLEAMTVDETIDHAIRAHRRRTGEDVAVSSELLPDQAPLATKIALYRVIQEALANAWRHAKGAKERVTATGVLNQIRVEVADDGPGFEAGSLGRSEEHLGLLGMRERVESLGGEFRIETAPGLGTRVIALLPVQVSGVGDD
jgi:signal transduction histidine kinase